MKINKTLYFCLYCFVFTTLYSCNEKVHDIKEFNTWINNNKNGAKISRSVHGVTVTVIVLPPEYVTLKQIEDEEKKNSIQYDSILQSNKKVVNILMIIGPDESKNNHDDIMYSGLKDFKEYVERSQTLNFDMEKKVRIETNGKSYAPVLSSLENTYGLGQDRKINFVFTPEKEKDELEKVNAFDFIYDDENFGVGTLHFEFNLKEIENNLPRIIFE